MPSTVLAVDGSARTLSCVDEIPSAGATVGVGGGGSGVSVGRAVSVGCNVVVRKRGVAEAVCVGLAFAVQLLVVNTMMKIDKMRLDLTE